MDIRGSTEFSVKKNDLVYTFNAPQGANYAEVHCVVLELLAHTTEKLQEISKAALAAAPQEVPGDKTQGG